MTKPNFTSINVIIDESSSMSSLRDTTISGFNEFLKDQREAPGEAVLSLTKFNTSVKQLHDCAAVKDIPDLSYETYAPGGCTALLDAVGLTMNKTGQQLSAMKEEDRPSKVIFLIMTDGQENSSREFRHEQIKEMINHQRDKYSWEFVFLGAGVDAFAAGTSLGISGQNTYSYVRSAAATTTTYNTVSSNMRRYRLGNSSRADFFDTPQDVVTSDQSTTGDTTTK